MWVGADDQRLIRVGVCACVSMCARVLCRLQQNTAWRREKMVSR